MTVDNASPTCKNVCMTTSETSYRYSATPTLSVPVEIRRSSLHAVDLAQSLADLFLSTYVDTFDALNVDDSDDVDRVATNDADALHAAYVTLRDLCTRNARHTHDDVCDVCDVVHLADDCPVYVAHLAAFPD